MLSSASSIQMGKTRLINFLTITNYERWKVILLWQSMWYYSTFGASYPARDMGKLGGI